MTTFRHRILAAASAAALAAALLAGAPSQADPAQVGTSSADRAGARAVPTRVLDVSDLPTGAPPRVAWAETAGRRVTIHSADGLSRTPVPRTTGAFAPMGEGYVIQTYGKGRPRTRWVATDGTPGGREWRTGYGLAVSPHGGAVAFTTRRGGVRVLQDEGTRVVRMRRVPARGFASPAVVSNDDCVESSSSNGCSVHVNSATKSRSWVTTSHGIVDRAMFRNTTTGRGRWIGGITKVSDTGSCSRMRRSWRKSWTTCRNILSDIAPDKRHLLGTPAYADGFGPTSLDVLSLRDGSRTRRWVSSRTGESATYFDEIWEDAEHVLVVTFQDREWAVVRLGLDGSMEYAVAPRRGSSDLAFPFQLQAR